jgi:UDP-2,3-diacylglucosamine pyrophosphatase LpxH
MKPTYLPVFAELYVVSDLHLGGEKTADSNFQIFNRGDRLAGLIDRIASIRPDEDVALVLNGDIIDSLAEEEVPGYVALDADTALKIINRVWVDASFEMVWDALSKFIKQPRRHLIFVVGNHDIELALPVVEADIRQRLTNGDLGTNSRITFSTHGAGFGCNVGRARVFCTHGNELDSMNWVDYNLLGQLANAIMAGRTGKADKWKPNGGTRLVIDVMNIVKKNYPFVDLLKPETAAIAGVLVAIDHDTFSKVDLADTFPILKNALRGHSVTSNLLGADGKLSPTAPQQVVADIAIQELLGPNLREAIIESRGGRPGASEDDLLMEAAAVAGNVRPVNVRPAGTPPATLGAWDLIAGWVGLVSKAEGLRKALQDWLKGDDTYRVHTSNDELFNDMKDRVADTIDFTITGHTHLARALRFPRGGYYYNCGTWIRLLQLTPEVLENSEAFERDLWPALNARRMDVLDTIEIPGKNGKLEPLVFDRTNAVRISAQGTITFGDLLRVGGQTRAAVTLDIEPDTTTFKVG